MSKEQKIILLDTNIWLDYLDVDRERHRAAVALIEHADLSNNVELLCFGGSMKDIYYISHNKFKQDIRKDVGVLSESAAVASNELAWASIDAIDEIVTIIPCDMRTVWMARKLKGICSDFEDCLLLAACELADVDFLVTNDERLQKIAPTKAADAETVLTLLQPFLD